MVGQGAPHAVLYDRRQAHDECVARGRILCDPAANELLILRALLLRRALHPCHVLALGIGRRAGRSFTLSFNVEDLRNFKELGVHHEKW
jgi:hypothetical protein